MSPLSRSEQRTLLATLRRPLTGNLTAEIATVLKLQKQLEPTPHDPIHNRLRLLAEARLCLLYASKNPGLLGPINQMDDHLKTIREKLGKAAPYSAIGTSKEEVAQLRLGIPYRDIKAA